MQLASIGCYSRSHFDNVFRELTGETLGACIRRRRLDWAADRLVRTRQTIIQIALAAGFQSHEAFTRAFRSRFGMAPVSFRQVSGTSASLRSSIRIAMGLAKHLHEVAGPRSGAWKAYGKENQREPPAHRE